MEVHAYTREEDTELPHKHTATVGVADTEFDMFGIYTKSQKRAILLTCGFIAIITPFTDTIYLPALADVAEYFKTTDTMVSATVSAYLGAIALGQLIFGPLADRYGRLIVIYCGLIIYEALTIACIFAPTIEALIVLRTFEGLVVSSSAVSAQAMIADIFAPEERGSAMGVFMAPLLIGPVIAPLIGGALASSYHWQGTFILLCCLTVPIALSTMAFIRHETHHWFAAKRLGLFQSIAPSSTFAIETTLAQASPEVQLAKSGTTSDLPLGPERGAGTAWTSELVVSQDLPGQDAVIVEPSKAIAVPNVRTLVPPVLPPQLLMPWEPLAFLLEAQLAPYYAVGGLSFASMFTTLTLLPIYLAQPPYSLSASIIGLTYIPVGVSMLIASVFGGWLSDVCYARLGRDGTCPDGRITWVLPGMWLLVAGSVCFGFTLQQGAHLAVLLVLQSVIGFGQALPIAGTMGFLSSCKHDQAAAAGSVSLFLNFGWSAVVVSVAVIASDAIGAGYFFLILAALTALTALWATVCNLSRVFGRRPTQPELA